jgi:hypothetical protein
MVAYLVALMVGGFFVGMSALSGGGDHFDHDTDLDHDFDHDFDHEIDVDADADIDADADADADADHDAHLDVGDISWYMPFLSFKFWTFGSLTFGLTGTALSLLHQGEPITAIVSSGLGLTSGYGVSFLIKKLRLISTQGQITMRDYNGQIAKVLVPFKFGQKGKVEIIIKDSHSVMLAKTEDEDADFSINDKCIVMEIKDGYAYVISDQEKLLE